MKNKYAKSVIVCVEGIEPNYNFKGGCIIDWEDGYVQINSEEEELLIPLNRLKFLKIVKDKKSSLSKESGE